ncbi:hypothetical protein WDW86_10180 [Bdellovibrionota bacterium FG-2]
MKQNIIRAYALAAALVFLDSAQAQPIPGRISARFADLGEVHKIYLAQGLAAVIQLPYPVTEAKVGSPGDIQVQTSKTLPSELTLILKQAGAKATNLIIRCGTRTFVFDLIPSTKTHQDLVRISGSYGSPEVSDMSAVLIDASSPLPSKSKDGIPKDEMTLIDSSETHESVAGK